MYVAVGLCTCSACLWYVGHSGMDSGVSSLVAGGHGTLSGISQRLSSQGELLESSWAWWQMVLRCSQLSPPLVGGSSNFLDKHLHLRP